MRVSCHFEHDRPKAHSCSITPHDNDKACNPLYPVLLPSSQKPGKWCAVHVQIAWQIYHHQQKMKVRTSCATLHLGWQRGVGGVGGSSYWQPRSLLCPGKPSPSPPRCNFLMGTATLPCWVESL